MYRDVVKAQRAHIKTLYGIGAILFLAALFNGAGWYAATRELPSIGVRPDLSRFATLRPGEYHPHEIYGFAQAIWQGLNRWPQDGQKEYAENLYRFQAYLTPDFYAEREADLKERARRGELSKRGRGLQPIPGREYSPEKVKPLSETSWVVYVDLQLQEWHGSTPVKDTLIRYPLKVMVFDVDRERNPWGLGLDGFAEQGYYRLDPETARAEVSLR